MSTLLPAYSHAALCISEFQVSPLATLRHLTKVFVRGQEIDQNKAFDLKINQYQDIIRSKIA